MSRLNYMVYLFCVALFGICLVGGKPVMGQTVDALDILRKCAENLKATDRIQYKIKMHHSYHDPATRTDVLPHEHVEAVIRREGNNIVVTGVEEQHNDGRFVRDKKIHLVTTPDFFVVGFSGENAEHSAGIVTTKQINERLPSILCCGQFGFEMDSYVSDGIRLPDLMLLEPDKVKYVGEEEVNGFFCKQIDADTKYGLLSVYVDTRNGYTICRAVSKIGQHTLLYSGNMWLQDQSQTESFTRTLNNFEFRLIEGVNLSTRGDFHVFRKDKNGHTCMSKHEFERENIDLNPVFGKDTFSADFLKGEVVSNMDDTESGVVYVWDGTKPIPGYTMLEGGAFMQGYAGFRRLSFMLLTILLIAIALYRILRRRKKHE